MVTCIPRIIRDSSVKLREMPFLAEIVELRAFNGLRMSSLDSDFVELSSEAGLVENVVAAIALKQQQQQQQQRFVSSVNCRE